MEQFEANDEVLRYGGETIGERRIRSHREHCSLCSKILDIIAEFGDNPAECLAIIREYVDSPIGKAHSINADGHCNLGCC